MSRRIACIAAVIGLVILVGCGEQPAPPATPTPAAVPVAAADGEALFKESCAVCHLIGKPIAYKGDTPWKDIVDRMILHGAKITPENAALILKHLETTYPRPQK